MGSFGDFWRSVDGRNPNENRSGSGRASATRRPVRAVGAFDPERCEPIGSSNRGLLHGGTTGVGMVPERILRRKPNGNARLQGAGGCHDILSGHQRFRIQHSRLWPRYLKTVQALKQFYFDFVTRSINKAVDVSATLNGSSIKVQRFESVPFAVANPPGNIFGPNACSTDVPLARDIYSPGITDGYWVAIPNLKASSTPYTILLCTVRPNHSGYHLQTHRDTGEPEVRPLSTREINL